MVGLPLDGRKDRPPLAYSGLSNLVYSMRFFMSSFFSSRPLSPNLPPQIRRAIRLYPMAFSAFCPPSLEGHVSAPNLAPYFLVPGSWAASRELLDLFRPSLLNFFPLSLHFFLPLLNPLVRLS